MSSEMEKQDRGRKLRSGFTTGSCAAAAAWGAARLALSQPVDQVAVCRLVTPGGAELSLALTEREQSENWGRCAVQKDSGDDPDVTNGILVYAEVQLQPGALAGAPADAAVQAVQVEIHGGEGVGRVTKPGLACQVGQAAINPTPRRMIGEQVQKVLEESGFVGLATVTISIPRGRELAARTYNPRLGIEGGISILGTTGIVKPMSEQALIDTIKVEMNMRKAAGARYLLLTPGNYGETFLRQTMDLGKIYTVQCSNFLGEALDYAVECGFSGVLLTAHIGKLVKVAGGVMNTHSKYGDCRLEILTAHTALCGGLAGAKGQEMANRLMECVTTDDAIALLDQLEESNGSEMRQRVMQSLIDKVEYHIGQRTGQTMEVGAVMFSNKYGLLAQTDSAAALIEHLRREQQEDL